MKTSGIRKFVLFLLPLTMLICSCGRAPSSENDTASETEKMLTEPETTSVADVTTQSEIETTADKTDAPAESVATITLITQSETEITQGETESETETETKTEAPDTTATLSPSIADDGISAENIAEIYVSHHGENGITESEYRVDLENGQYWSWRANWDGFWEALYAGELPREPSRDETAENGGYDLICELSADKTAAFCVEADEIGFTSWNDEYTDPLLVGGHVWIIEITYLDGSKKSVFGSNDYPDTWDEMGEAFLTLTGSDRVL